MKFKDSIKQFVYANESINLTKDEEQFIELIKDAIFEEVKNIVNHTGGSLNSLEVKCSVKYDITGLHSIPKIERYFEEIEEFVSFKFNVFNSIIKSALLPADEYTFSFTAIIY